MKNLWKKGKQTYRSSYDWLGFYRNLVFYKVERVFCLTNTKTGRVISFESHQAAKKQGYVKL